MSTTIGLVNLLQTISNQTASQGQEPPAAVQKAAAQSNPAPSATVGDQFTPSSQNGQSQATAQAAGLFSVAQPALFSPTATQLLQPNSASAANPATATPTAAAAAPTAPTAAPAAAAPAAATVATLVTTQEQLQALNLALAELGLSNQDIQQLDQIASTIDDYSPAAYTARAFQLEALAQRAPAQAAPATAANRPAAANNATARTASTAAAQAAAAGTALAKG